MPKSDFVSVPSSCTLCPRRCGADRAAGRTGFCGAGGTLKAARAALHYWEEPCISGTKGSGTVFFSGCTLKCCFCQNYPLSAELSSAPDYFAQAKPAIEAMMAQAGHPVFNAEGILQKGVILRHLALPGHVDDSFAVLDQMAAWNDADPGCFIPSVMSQYTPFYNAAEHGIGRRITTYEYRRVVNYAMDKGLAQGYMQQKSSAKEEYTPSFDLTGV